MRKAIISLFVVLSLTLSAQNLDLKILKSLNKNEYPVWDNIMWGFSASVYPAMPLTVAGIWTHGQIRKDPVLTRSAYKSAFCIGFATLTSTAIKFSVNRKRPKAKYPNDIIERDRSGKYSFPSGHTTAAFATATALSFSYNYRWQVAIPAYTYAAIVGYSRMRLGMHFGTDVLGGIVVGIGAGILTWKLDKAINGK